jgi:hypothetical protein
MAARPIPTAKTQKLTDSILAGMPKLPSTLTSLSILGKTYTMADLATQLQVYKSKFDASGQAHAAAKTADDDVQKIAAEANEFVSEAKAALKAALGRKSSALETVGVKPDKTPAPLPLEKEVERAAKAKATRAARHTMGKKQKAAIHGQVPPVPTPPKPGQ